MHRDNLRIQLANNRGLIENLSPWQNAIYLFGYSVLGQMGAFVFEPLPPPSKTQY